MTHLALNQRFFSDPFKTLFYQAIADYDFHNLSDRVEFLDSLSDGLHNIENSIKNGKESQGWMGITSAFSTAITVSAFMAIGSPIVAALGVLAGGCALLGASESLSRNFKLSPVADDLERYYLALRSTEMINWASMWDYCHKCYQSNPNPTIADEMFRNALFKASRGTVQGDRLIRRDNTKEPFIAGIKAIASRQGRSVEDVATFIRAVKESFLNQQIKPVDSGWLPDGSNGAPQLSLGGAVSGSGSNVPQFSRAISQPVENVVENTPSVAPAYQPSPNTQLGAIPVQSQSATSQSATSQSATSQSATSQPAVKTPLFANNQINSQVLAMSLSDRAQLILDYLAESNCNIRSLMGRPTLASGGLQRSGKTTLILLTGILEKALGQKLYYISRDNDDYPIAYDGFASGSIGTALGALETLSQTINASSMGGLKGQTWILDEFSSIASELKEAQQTKFWGMALTGFAKQGGRVRFMVHHKTAGANGLPKGQAETFKAEVKMLWTDRVERADGNYFPSGNYTVLAENRGYYQETDEKFTIPNWLKFDKNPKWHNSPCPVRSLLRFFPELDTRMGAIAVSLLEDKKSDTGFTKDLDVDFWESNETIAPQAPIKTASIAQTHEQLIDRKLADINEAIQQIPQGTAVSVNAIEEYFKVDRASAIQLATMYAFRNKAIASYDPTSQSIIRR